MAARPLSVLSPADWRVVKKPSRKVKFWLCATAMEALARRAEVRANGLMAANATGRTRQ